MSEPSDPSSLGGGAIDVDALVDELLRRHRAPADGGENTAATGRVDLDDLEELIGDRAISYEEVELVITRLERAGMRVGDQLSGGEVELIQRVVGAAARLRGALGRPPRVEEIAEQEGIPEYVVRRSLEQARRTAR